MQRRRCRSSPLRRIRIRIEFILKHRSQPESSTPYLSSRRISPSPSEPKTLSGCSSGQWTGPGRSLRCVCVCVCLSVCLYASVSVCMSVCLPVVCLCVCMSVCLYACVSVCLSVRLFCPSVCFSFICLLVCVCLCVFVCLYVTCAHVVVCARVCCVCLPLCVSVIVCVYVCVCFPGRRSVLPTLFVWGTRVVSHLGQAARFNYL